MFERIIYILTRVLACLLLAGMCMLIVKVILLMTDTLLNS